MTSQTKPKICHLSYSTLHHMPQTMWRWFCEACNCGHGHDRRCKTADTNKICIQNCGIRTSLVNLRRPKTERGRRILWWCHAARASSGEQANAADMCICWTRYYGSSKMWNAFKLDHYRIIVSLSWYFWFIVSFIDRKQYLTYRNSTNNKYKI